VFVVGSADQRTLVFIFLICMGYVAIGAKKEDVAKEEKKGGEGV